MAPEGRKVGSLNDVEKVHAVGAGSTFRSQNVNNATCSPLLDTRTSFRVAGARDCGPCQKSARREVLWHVQKQWQAWDI